MRISFKVYKELLAEKERCYISDREFGRIMGKIKSDIPNNHSITEIKLERVGGKVNINIEHRK